MIRLYDFDEVRPEEILNRDIRAEADVEATVDAIIADVRARGDAALIEYAAKFDHAELTDVRVSQAEIEEAFAELEKTDPEFITTLKMAAENIRHFHEQQLHKNFVVNDKPGIVLGQKYTPIQRAGVYVPGGTAAYPSTVLMDVIPAKVAGVGQIVMTTPAGRDGKVNPAILAAAVIAGIDLIFKTGGAQAVAALAYGTESVPAVDKIVGPGNIYVATAKRKVFGKVGIDMIAGPSEILVLADGGCNPAWVAADLLSQAEHDKLASPVLVTDSPELAKAVQAELEGQIEETLREFPSTGLIFIDTLQMVRDNTSAKVNAYAQDYKDLSGLKKLADDHGICIFVVHHTRKERDNSNIFNDMTGSTGILGVADTGMILRKDDRFGDCATLCITGRDVEEKKLKMQMRGVRWEITEALSARDLRKERIPDFVFQMADFLLAHGRFRGTVSQLLAAVGNTELKPNLASKHLTRHYSDVLLPLGITYEYRKTAAARLVLLELHDGADGHDGSLGSERLASLRKQNDGTFRLPQASSQASSASWEEAEDDEELPL